MYKDTVSGSCLCGKVRFQTELPSKWCAHCHCTMCRKYHGAGYVTWVGLEEQRFHLQDEQSLLHWYESSTGARRGFCSNCGTSLFFQSEQWAGEIHVALGAFDQPIDRQPQAHAFYKTHVDWMPIDESLKIFKG